jgi:tRNA (guanine-N7-)-methyltransferase
VTKAPPVKPAYAAIISQRRIGLRNIFAQILSPGIPLVWEVGCGHGHFLTAYAANHPDRLCVGIDIVADRIERAERKSHRARLSNLHFLHADANDFLASLPEETRFSAIYMLFPDPWPKRRHHKNRLLQPKFLHAIAQRAGQGTPFHFRTDFEPYFTEARATFAIHPDWSLQPEAAWPFELPTIFQQKAATYHSLIAERKRH